MAALGRCKVCNAFMDTREMFALMGQLVGERGVGRGEFREMRENVVIGI